MGSSSLILLSPIGPVRWTGSYLALNQSGMTTALRSSWMVIPRALASSLSNVNVCSPKATMTLYDIFFTLPLSKLSGVSNTSRLFRIDNPYKNAGFDRRGFACDPPCPFDQELLDSDLTIFELVNLRN